MLLLTLLLACNGKAPDDAPADDSAPLVDSEPQRCGTALQELPEGLIELSWDDGQGDGSVSDFGFEPDGHVRDLPLHEGVRFELAHPARVYGFAIQYTLLPSAEDSATPEQEVAAGLYADFGHNGFDYWHAEPLWEGTRCLSELGEGEWVTYALEEPLDVDPGLLYAGHFRDGMADPAVFIDFNGPAECAAWDDCHSTLNLPELTFYGGTPYWSGVTFPLQYPYMIRLYVEYTSELAPEDTVFQDITAALSISTRVAWGDYDNDGDDDLLTAGLRLYRNEGGGAFTDVTEAAGLSGHSGSSGGVWGDYDNDGCLDLIGFAESYTASETLLRSDCDGSFTDVTEAAGLSDVQSANLCGGDASRDRTPTSGAAWFDLDNDGLLDLALSNFMCWDDYSYYADSFWLNDGEGGFTELSGERGFGTWRLASRGVAPADVDGDGDVELFFNNYVLQRNIFYDNLGDGTVDEVGDANGAGGHRDRATGYYGHTIGAAFGDLDGDGDLDLIAANLAHPRFWDFSNKTQVLINDGDGQFSDLAQDWSDPFNNPAGLRYQETHSVPVLADFDSDGHLDLSISAVYDGRPTDFYWGLGDGRFELDAYHAGIHVENGWGMAVADLDNDGDVDLAAKGALLRNDHPQGEWLQVRAIGDVDSNWGAYGATVRAYGDGRVFTRHVQGGSGQGDQDSAYLQLGLGELQEVEHIEVDFPGGGTVTFEGPFPAGERYWLFESGRVEAGWGWPG